MKKEMLKNRSGKISSGVLRMCAVISVLAVMCALTVVFGTMGEKLGFVSLIFTMPEAGKSIIYEKASVNPYIRQDTETQDVLQDEKLGVVTDESEESNIILPTVRLVSEEKILKVSSTEKYETPSDIAALINEANKKLKSAEKAGDIVEASYVGGGSYSGYKDLWVLNSTGQSLNVETLYSKKPKLKIKDDGTPSVLIYHTHTNESYVDLDNGWYSTDFTSRSSDCGRNVVRVGDAMTEALENAGFNVIHDRTIHDESYNGSYQRSRAQAELYLELYPSIVITLDVHRDALNGSDSSTIIKPVATVDGKKAAQIMIIAGREGGQIASFPNWENNLAFAAQIQNKVNELYYGLMRPIFHCYRMYNMDITPNSLLVEVGTHGNTLDEAVYAGTLFGNALGEMLKEYVVK